MPVQIKSENGKCYARWGNQGAKYYYKCGSKIARENAKKKAIRQGIAIGDFAESFNDYPQAATDNAQIALNWAEKNGWGECGTPVGKIRANQLAKREPISRDTIARMAAFERHRQNSDKQLGDGCGRLMWLAWGGDEGIAWAQRKLIQINKQAFAENNNKVSIDFDDTLSTEKGQELAKNLMAEGKDVYIITRRNHRMGAEVYDLAKKFSIPADRVYFTDGKLKWEEVKRLGIAVHYDNNQNEIDKINENTDATGILVKS